MRITKKGKRILSLVLALSLMTALMQPLSIPGRSEGLVGNAEQLSSDAGLSNYGANIGAVAQWNNVTSVLLASNHYESKGDVCGGVAVRLLPGKLAIVDYAYDEVSAVLWYKVDAAPGYTWPEEYANYHWVDAYTIRIVAQNGMTGVFDAEGNAVTELSMDIYDTPVLTADSSLQGSVEYQWQIEYKTGKWVDIYGENEKELTVTIGILASLLDSNDTVKVRCVSRTEEKSATSTEIAVKVNWNADGDSDETTAQQDPAASSDAPTLRSAAANEGVAATAEVEEYTVTITYKYENGEQAYEYFVGEVSPGETLAQKVIFPVIPGYAPYLNNERVDSLELNIIGNEVTEDILYEVVYKPTLVNVTVVIEHQNVYDDGYTPVETRVIQRLTGSYIETITEFADKYPGFYQLEHSKPEVASDGSTTVTIKFNRLYYLMRFDLGEGGYGVQPVYARIDTEVEVPEPRRPGYIFQNWKSYDGSTVNEVDGMAKFTMPAYACTVTAIWEATKVNYTVVYWKENADPNADGNYGYSYWTSEVVPSKAGEYVSGGNTVKDIKGENAVDDAKYFTYNDARTDKNVLVKGDGSTVVNVYYTRNSYTIYFYGKGDCAIPEHTHGTGCNSYLICGKENHTHDENCGDKILSCDMEEHAHSEACCTVPEHTKHTSECCTAVHTHSASCYTVTYKQYGYTVTLKLSAVQDDPTYNYGATTWDNGIVRTGWKNNYSYYIKLDGKWYKLSPSSGSGPLDLDKNTKLNGAVSCTKVHEHTDGTCTCDKGIHAHGNGNCSCPKPVHAHTDSCYKYSDCSEEVHTHTDACYNECTLVKHTHGNNCPTKNDGNYKVIRVITAKYEADIHDEWPTADHFKDLASWSGNGTTQSSRVVTMSKTWCDDKAGLIEVTANYDYTEYQLNYWFEDVNQTSTSTSSAPRVYNSTYGKYYVLSEKYSQTAYYGSTSTWGYKEITGMKAATTNSAQREEVDEVYTFNLYYNRIRYKLEFKNVDEVIHTENQVVFEKPLNYYLDEDGKYIDEIIPDYPEGKEVGAYEFAGWYTTPECFEGTEFDFASGKMPNGDLVLFAKWAPVKHNVTFYTSKDSATGKLKGKIGETVAVPHGSKINEQYIPEAPEDFENGQYSFDGWFYMDHGVEKAFSFADMTVTQELNVYARWISNKQINYIFHFELADGTVIADPVTGSGLAGETITVNAKGDTALYAGYQLGFFPNVKSHSIDLDIEDEDGLMEYRFVYTPVDAVPYAVYYVAETLKEGDDPSKYSTMVIDGKTYYIIAPTDEYEGNRKAYVVEQFKAVPGYLPDAYQKSSPIANGQTNEIIFYYTVDSTRAYYKVTHYIQNLDGTSWAEYRVSQSQGLIGKDYSAAPLDIPGYTYNGTTPGTLTSGTLTADGLELKLYYERNKYPYKFVYKVQGTEEVLYDSTADGTVETDLYEKIISHPAPDTYGIYDLVGNATQTLSIRIEDDPTNPKLNVLTFYYAEREVDIDYKLVGPDGTLYDENQTWGALTSFGESVKVTTGTVNGSTASAKSNVYKFIGWYSDPECNNFITSNATLVPAKEDGVTYYAKFEYDLTTLTIKVNGCVDRDQAFIFRVTGNDGVNLRVTVTENGSVTIHGLTIGKSYTVTMESWPWRYEVKDITSYNNASGTKNNSSITVVLGADGVVTYTVEQGNPWWLDGNSPRGN